MKMLEIVISSICSTQRKFIKSFFVFKALSLVLENAAFHGDLALHFPDIYHKYYDNNKEFKNVLTWAVKLAAEAELYDEVSTTMLNLVII